jgi:dCTP deaminase
MGVLADWQIERDIKIEPFAKPLPGQKLGKISYGLGSYGYDVRCGYKFKVFTNVWGKVIDPMNFDPQAFVDVDLTPQSHDFLSDGFCAYCQGTQFSGPDQVTEGPDWMKGRGPCTGLSQPPDHIIIPPNSFALAESLETFTIPRDVLCIVMGKSTYARCGLIVNVTPGEPEWTGKWTIEISNTTPLPAKVYCGLGIMQAIFLRTDGHSEAGMNAVRRLCDENLQRASNMNTYTEKLSKQWRVIEELLHMELGRGTCRVSYADKKGKYQDQVGLTLPAIDEDGK